MLEYAPLLHARILFPSRVTVRTLVHPNRILLIELYRNYIRFSRCRSRRAVLVRAHDIRKVIQGRIILEVRIHNKTSRLIFLEKVFVYNWILAAYNFFVLTLPTALNRSLYSIDGFLVNGIEHISTSWAKLHSFSLFYQQGINSFYRSFKMDDTPNNCLGSTYSWNLNDVYRIF